MTGTSVFTEDAVFRDKAFESIGYMLLYGLFEGKCAEEAGRLVNGAASIKPIPVLNSI